MLAQTHVLGSKATPFESWQAIHLMRFSRSIDIVKRVHWPFHTSKLDLLIQLKHRDQSVHSIVPVHPYRARDQRSISKRFESIHLLA